MNTRAALLAAVQEAFVLPARPDRFTVNSSDDEVARAETIFAARTAETLQATDVGIGASWPEVFLNQPSRIYFMPAFVRLILESNDDNGFQVNDFFAMLSPDRIAQFDQQQKAAIANVLVFIRAQLDDHDREILDRRLKRLRN